MRHPDHCGIALMALCGSDRSTGALGRWRDRPEVACTGGIALRSLLSPPVLPLQEGGRACAGGEGGDGMRAFACAEALPPPHPRLAIRAERSWPSAAPIAPLERLVAGATALKSPTRGEGGSSGNESDQGTPVSLLPLREKVGFRGSERSDEGFQAPQHTPVAVIAPDLGAHVGEGWAPVLICGLGWARGGPHVNLSAPGP